MDYRRNYRNYRALLSDHQLKRRRDRRWEVISDVIVVLAAPALLALFLYAGEILIALGVL